jgi:hypothetical protein
VPYRYLGYETRTYVQYLDQEAGTTLVADPGGSYDMLPAGSWDMPVPPPDGLWEQPRDAPEDEDPAAGSGPPGQGEPADVPPPLMTAASTEDEGN